MIRAMLLALALLPLAASAARCRALDGDTLQCGAERVRLYRVYAAEMNQAGGAEARRKLQRQVAGREVRLRRHGVDRYGRRIRQADIDPRAGRGVNSGYASKPK